MHVSLHFNGWGDFPNPNDYTQAKIHAQFEGAFVRENADRDSVAAGVGAYVDCHCTIEERTRALLLMTLANLEPLYQLEKEGGLVKSDKRGIAFVNGRLSAGTQAVGEFIVDAWQA